jgi:hypothetical protein
MRPGRTKKAEGSVPSARAEYLVVVQAALLSGAIFFLLLLGRELLRYYLLHFFSVNAITLGCVEQDIVLGISATSIG